MKKCYKKNGVTFVILKVGHGDEVLAADSEMSDGLRVGAWQDPLLEGIKVTFLPVVEE